MGKDNMLSRLAQIATIIVVPLTIVGLLIAYLTYKQGNNSNNKIEANHQTSESSKIEPSKTESSKIEPSKTESSKIEPSKTESSKIEPSKTKSLKIEPSKTESSKTEPPMPKVSKYFNSNQKYDIAILSKNNKSNIENKLKSHFKTKGFKSSSSVFNSAFKSTSYFENLGKDASGLKAIGTDKATNCIFLIDEKISFEQKERFGTPFFKSTGNYSISIIDIINGKINNYNIETIGAGTSESLATKSIHEHLLENEDFKTINLTQCKN